MIETNFSEADLAAAVAPLAGVSGDQLRFTRSATGRFNETWFVDGGGWPLVLRIAPPDDRGRMLFYEHRMMRQEPEVHALVRERTSAPVPEIVAFRENDPSLGRDFLLMEPLPGKPLSDSGGLSAKRADHLFSRVGACLREVHGIVRDRYGYLGAHRPMEPQSRWADAFAVMWNMLIDDIVACRGYTAEEADGMRWLLDKHRAVFDRNVPASLLHMDVWAENLLCDAGGELTGIIDWDRALWGDPEIEFAVLDYCGVSTPAFWEGYGRQRDTSPDARIRRIFYLLYEVQKYIVIQRARRHNPNAADRYRSQCLDLAEALV